MQKALRIYLIFLLLLSSDSIYSQFYDMGQDPSGLKWKQIKTENFQIIFPQEFTKDANRLANILEIVYDYGSYTLNHKPKKISVILHTQTVKSNASVIWTPKRMEIYTCPPQDILAQDWLEHLAIHEFRHVVQVDKINQGITKILTFLLGQQATAAVLGLYIPEWLLEGDAVLTETLLSKSGRGRLPAFEMELRTQCLEKGAYKYNKAVFGSYKDFVTNHYKLGYYFVTTARKNYGPELWENTFNNVARKPFMIVPFNNSIKKSTGLSKVKLYNSVMDELDSLWKQQFSEITYTPFKLISAKSKKHFTDYSFPHFINDSTYFAVKSGIDDITRFVKIDSKGNEKKLFTPGYIQTDAICFCKNNIVWAETKYDIRWENRSFSNIKTYNIKTRKLKTLTKKGRFFAPSFSDDGNKIVTVEVSTENKYSIVILNSETGEIVKKISSLKNDFFMTPTFADDDKNIVAIAMNNNGKTIAMINVETGKIEYLFPFSFEEISVPIKVKGIVYFVAAYSGIDNIYAFDTKIKSIFQVTSSQFGVNNPDFSADGKKIIYKNYSAMGFDIVEAENNPEKWKPISETSNNSIKLYETLLKQEKGIISSDSIPNKEYKVKKYIKPLHLFNIHSWGPLVVDANNATFNPGASIMSQNKLSTAFTTIGYEWDINEESGTYFADFSYKGLYPEINFRYEYGDRKGVHVTNQDSSIKYNWKETKYETGISLPLKLTSNKWIKGLNPQIHWNYIKLYMDESSKSKSKNDKFNAVDYRLFLYNQIKKSRKDIYPKWGQTFDLNYRYTPFLKSDVSSVYSLETWLYFPGLINHHGIRFYSGYQNKIFNNYSFSDFVNYPRGFTDQYSDELLSFKADYKFPFLYPDFSVGSLVYLKRLKANIFYDYAKGEFKDYTTYYRSAGFEIIGDMHLLRFIAPIEIGVRGIYLPDKNTTQFEMIFSVGFDSI